MGNHLAFLGMLGILQACLIPGFIFTRVFFGRLPFCLCMPMSFAFSLTINWVIFFYLNYFISYPEKIFYILLIIELVALLILLIIDYKIKSNIVLKKTNVIININIINYYIIFILAIVTIAKIGNVFYHVDAVRGWNTWATGWGQWKMPVSVFHYPQLLPVAYGIPYLFMGANEIQFFSFFIGSLFFPIALTFIYGVANYLEKEVYYYWCLSFFLLFSCGYLLTSGISNGLADTPVTCMGIFAICLYLIGIDEKGGVKYIVASIIVSGAAAATKQAGIYISLCLMVLAIHWVLNKKILNISQNFFLILSFIAINFLIYLYWYYTNEINIIKGLNISEISHVTSSIYEEKNIPLRLLDAFKSHPYYLFCGIILTLGIRSRDYRIFSIFGFIFLLIWSIFFSYDGRNFSICFIFISLSLGFIIFDFREILPKINIKILKIQIQNFYKLIIIIILTILFISIFIPNNVIYYLQNKSQENVGQPKYNKAIYRAFDLYGYGLVMANEPLIEYASRIPSGTLFYYDFTDKTQGNILKFKDAIDTKKVKFIILDPDNISPELKIILNQNLLEKNAYVIDVIQMNGRINTFRYGPVYHNLYMIKN